MNEGEATAYEMGDSLEVCSEVDAANGNTLDAVVSCPHRRVTITEFGGWITEHTREDGGWTHNNEPGCYNSKLMVECHDCGHRGYYWRGAKRKPKWLRDALETLGV